jgi:hypothetical protein
MIPSYLSSVVAVSRESLQEELLDALLYDRNDYDVIHVESFALAYSRIKELRPDLIVVFMSRDDDAGCRLLSMLSIDRDVAGIPVVMSVSRLEKGELDEIVAEINRSASNGAVAVAMN